MAAGKSGWLATVNVSILMMMRENPRLQSFVDRATWTVADGQPLVWVSRWFGTPLPERVTGVDLVEQICAEAETRGMGVYFLGASQPVLDALILKLSARYPRLSIGHSNGYFPATDAPLRAASIAASGASVLLVGMGVPRQEEFIETQWAQLGVKLAIGVGGSFDVLAGLRKRAPLGSSDGHGMALPTGPRARALVAALFGNKHSLRIAAAQGLVFPSFQEPLT